MCSPHTKLAEAATRDGGRLTLYEHGGSFCIRVNGLPLMHSAARSSELFLGELGVEGLSRRTAPRILIGGLGLGFTLKSVLQHVGPSARVQVAEIVPEVIDWNQRFMQGLNGHLLDDPRVEVFEADIWEILIRAEKASYDAMLFDVDNGPHALARKQNARLYNRDGLMCIAEAAESGGRAVFWSADPAPAFAERLAGTGFIVRTVPVRFHPAADHCAGTIYLGEKPSGTRLRKG